MKRRAGYAFRGGKKYQRWQCLGWQKVPALAVLGVRDYEGGGGYSPRVAG